MIPSRANIDVHLLPGSGQWGTIRRRIRNWTPFRGHDRLSRDEIYRRAVAAALPAESLTRIDALPEGEYAQDEAADALRQDQVPGDDNPDFADEHDNTTADHRVTAHEDLPDLEPESPRGLGGMER